MLTVDEISNGVVIDHITAGTGLALYHMMELEKLHDASVALLQNVRSQKSGKKDIIKIEGDVSGLNFDILGYLDPQITISVQTAPAAGERHQVHQSPLRDLHRGRLRPYLHPDPQRPIPLHLLRAGIPGETVNEKQANTTSGAPPSPGGAPLALFFYRRRVTAAP